MPAFQARRPARLTYPELGALTAAVMALNAFAIDMMLPALGLIGDALGATRDNDRQLVVGVYLMSNGVSQIFSGPLVDRFGRRPVLLFALGGYIAGSMMSVVAMDFAGLLAARAFQGAAAATARVAAIAAVRDQCAGRAMAKVMSLAMTVFMAAPIIAPAIGQLVMDGAPGEQSWRAIFLALLIYGLAIAGWSALRLAETLSPENRRPLQLRPINAD